MSDTIVNVEALLNRVASWERLDRLFRWGSPTIWYRGQSDSQHWIQPGVLRERFVLRTAEACYYMPGSPEHLHCSIALEQDLNSSARRMAVSLLSSTNLVDMYFEFQHFGLPTRLLDWTTNPLGALFFAVNNNPESDGRLFVLDTTKLRPGDPLDARDDLVAQTIEYLFGTRDVLPGASVLPIYPDWKIGRMLQQGSCFTLHAPGAPEITDEQSESCIIPKEHKADILDELSRLHVNWATLFPDLEHVIREVKRAWGV